MKRQVPGQCLRIYIGASDQWHGRPLYAAIVQEARSRGLAGATAARGIMGYGAHQAIHEPHLFQLTNHLPVVVEIIDEAEKMHAFLPRLDEMVQEGMITISPVDCVSYRADRAGT